MICQCVSCGQRIREPEWTRATQQGRQNPDTVYWCPTCRQQVQTECQAHLWHNLAPQEGDLLISDVLRDWFA